MRSMLKATLRIEAMSRTIVNRMFGRSDAGCFASIICVQAYRLCSTDPVEIGNILFRCGDIQINIYGFEGSTVLCSPNGLHFRLFGTMNLKVSFIEENGFSCLKITEPFNSSTRNINLLGIE